MTVGAARVEGPRDETRGQLAALARWSGVVGGDRLEPRLSRSSQVPRIGRAVAGETERRHGRVEQVLGCAAVGVVARGAVLGCRCVLEDPGPDVVLVALRAQGNAVAERGPRVAVGCVAISTGEHPFPNRVVGGEVQSRCHVRVALGAEARVGVQISEPDLAADPEKIRLALVRIVTVGADQPRALVLASRPGEMCLAAFLVAREAIGRRRETDVLGLLALGVDASEPVACLAVFMELGAGACPPTSSWQSRQSSNPRSSASVRFAVVR